MKRDVKCEMGILGLWFCNGAGWLMVALPAAREGAFGWAALGLVALAGSVALLLAARGGPGLSRLGRPWRGTQMNPQRHHLPLPMRRPSRPVGGNTAQPRTGPASNGQSTIFSCDRGFRGF